jgi:hypothetical protein
MYPDQKYRAFLLKMVDADIDAAIEEGILDGSIDPTHILQVEDELIDDSLFGRLSDEERVHFTTDFLCTPERNEKLAFAHAIKQYSAQQSSPIQRVSVWKSCKTFAAIPWSLPLAGTLACALLVAGWLTERNLTLRSELALTSRENDEHRRIIASLRQEQERMQSPHIATPSQSSDAIHGQELHRIPGNMTGQTSQSGDDLAELPVLKLSSGVSRSLAAVPVLQIGREASMVKIRLELPFDLPGTVREELLDSAGKCIWTEQFSASDSIAPHGIRTIILPVALFSSSDYRLRVEAGTSGEESAARVEYLFRVRRN